MLVFKALKTLSSLSPGYFNVWPPFSRLLPKRRRQAAWSGTVFPGSSPPPEATSWPPPAPLRAGGTEEHFSKLDARGYGRDLPRQAPGAEPPVRAQLPPPGRAERPLIPHHPLTHIGDSLQSPTPPLPAVGGDSWCGFQKQPFHSDKKASVTGRLPCQVHLWHRLPSQGGKAGAQKGSVSRGTARPLAAHKARRLSGCDRPMFRKPFTARRPSGRSTGLFLNPTQ